MKPVIEFHIQGRNDDYEPDWAGKVAAAMAYNRALCDEYGIDFRVAFAEWNPPPGKPLLSLEWAARFPFFRGVVVDAAVHDEIAGPSKLTIIPTHAANVLLRSCEADYFLISGGDIFLGRSTLQAIRDNGLKPGVIYRAERVNIDAALDFKTATPDIIEAPENLRMVDTCAEAPFFNASGDFIMLDRASFQGFRGCDEGIIKARLHIDYRCLMQPHLAGLPAVLLGRIYHIFHSQSYANPAQTRLNRILFNHKNNLPYLNPSNWGLWDYAWQKIHDRVWQVKKGAATDQEKTRRCKPFDAAEATRAAAMWEKLCEVAAHTQPVLAPPRCTEKKFAIKAINPCNKDIGVTVEQGGGGLVVTTAPVSWSYALQLAMASAEPFSADMYYWLKLDMEVTNGQIILLAQHGDKIIRETYYPADDQPADHACFPLQLPEGTSQWDIIIQNGWPETAARVTLRQARLFAAEKNAIVADWRANYKG